MPFFIINQEYEQVPSLLMGNVFGCFDATTLFRLCLKNVLRGLLAFEFKFIHPKGLKNSNSILTN